jgi:hypothetical protein
VSELTPTVSHELLLASILLSATNFEHQVSPAQYIQSHTILKSISHNYFGKPVLALGGKGDIIKNVVRG